jgi:predicted DNA-binding protein with PD1-like motif
MSNLVSGVMKAHACRLSPGEDLVPALENAAAQAMLASKCSSAFVMSAVGSLDGVTLRMANASRMDGENTTQNEILKWEERFEIVSLIGTFSSTGKHLHMSVSDASGTVKGGHLMSGRIFTTLELVLGTIENVSFKREVDPATGYRELVVQQSNT